MFQTSIIYLQSIFRSITAFLLLNALTLAELPQPDIQFNREVIHDNDYTQTALFEQSGTPIPPPFVFRANFKRLLGGSTADINFDQELFHVTAIPVEKGFTALNIISSEGPFKRAIYLTHSDKIIGYALSEDIALYHQKDPPFLRAIGPFPKSQESLSKYCPPPYFGRVEVREKDRDGYVEQYALYYGPSQNAAILLMDAFYPKEFKPRLAKPLGRAIARQLRFYERYYFSQAGRALAENEFDESNHIGPEMD